MYIYTFTFIYSFTYTCIYDYMYTCIYVYIHTYTCIYIHAQQTREADVIARSHDRGAGTISEKSRSLLQNMVSFIGLFCKRTL